MRNVIKRIFMNHPKVYYKLKMLEIILKYVFKTVHDNDYLFFANFRNNSGLFIDIGANCGQSAISFSISNKKMKIVSFEPNKDLEICLSYIKKMLGMRYSYQMYGISENSGLKDFYIPKSGSVLITGEGTYVLEELSLPITRERLGGSFNIELFNFEFKSFDELNLKPNIIKIDVQGAEIDVLKGLRCTIIQNYPLFLIEMQGTEVLNEITEFFNAYKYILYSYNSKRNSLVPLSDQSHCENFFAIPGSREGFNSDFIQKCYQLINED